MDEPPQKSDMIDTCMLIARSAPPPAVEEESRTVIVHDKAKMAMPPSVIITLTRGPHAYIDLDLPVCRYIICGRRSVITNKKETLEDKNIRLSRSTKSLLSHRVYCLRIFFPF